MSANFDAVQQQLRRAVEEVSTWTVDKREALIVQKDLTIAPPAPAHDTFRLPFPPTCSCGHRYAEVWATAGPDAAAYWKCAGCGRLLMKTNVPGTIEAVTTSDSDRIHLRELMHRYLPKIQHARLYGMPIADMSRDELLAIAVWFCEKECDRYRMPKVSDLT